ncbi:hypothetical protein [Streptomyces pseudovenezuelae]|uniref:Type IV secretory pathway component VirB8 n=1 Tax=Streptomyces pseudovenezuelae TaxID=67350 RepID=A0ABT6LNE9_9ACTN|nr:hypothetical protein [Streptomyces pseudovenezuelae]MDH6217837.1 type IV secretory pathway component VirB8 [Streptomyces pseudovenezuelae]
MPDPEDTAGPPDPAEADRAAELDRQRLALEKRRERYVWYYLAYFLFGIHIVAFVMIYAVLHAK